jgi:hypothetical protein
MLLLKIKNSKKNHFNLLKKNNFEKHLKTEAIALLNMHLEKKHALSFSFTHLSKQPMKSSLRKLNKQLSLPKGQNP